MSDALELSADKLALAEREALAEIARRAASRHLEAYIDYCQLGVVPVAHHKLLIGELEAVERGETPRLMVCMPPGSAKSTYTSALFPPWYMGRSPAKSIIAASHTQELADSFGRRVRNLFASAEHRDVFGVGVAQDSQAAGRWGTERGGEYFAAGVGGSIAGRRADLGIIDDPVKSREAADSERERQKVWEWYVHDFSPRLKPDAAQILIMCMTGDTPILMVDGTEKLLRDIRAGDVVATHEGGRLTASKVINWKSQGSDFVFKIRTSSGITVRANKRHPFLVVRDGECQWQRLSNLRIGDVLMRHMAPGVASSAARKGAVPQRNARGVVCRITTNGDGHQGLDHHPLTGYLDGKPDLNTVMALAMTSTSDYSTRRVDVARFAESRPERMLEHIGAANYVSTIATKQVELEDCSATTATSRSGTVRQNVSYCSPLDMFEITGEEITEISASGIDEVFDIQVERTENFIANGLVSHNTRWHEDDLGGRILEREAGRWRVVEVPMEAMRDDPLGRKPGERLWPEWFTEEMVEHAKMDPRAWNALYQQQPAGEDGDYFKLDWFGEYSELPEALLYYGASDYAVTEGSGDYTEHGLFAIDALANIYVVDWWRGQTAADTWIEKQIDMISAHSPVCWFGEAGPIRRAIEPMLLRRMTERLAFCRIEWLSSVADKPTRCRPFQAMASMGKVFVPVVARWKADLLGQLVRFPAGKYDDGVDVCSLIGRGLEHVKAPRVRRAEAAAGEPRRLLQSASDVAHSWLGA